MEQFLTANNNKVDAVVSVERRHGRRRRRGARRAGPRRIRCRCRARTATRPRSNRVALGTQTVSVWKDARELGKAAGEAAVELAGGKTLDKVTGAVKFTDGPKKVEMNSILLAPIPITKDNLDVVIDAGWISKDEVCKGVKPGTVKVCG